MLAFCCALSGVSIWQLLVLQGEVADARQRVVQVAQQQVMTYLTSNLPQRTKQSQTFQSLFY
jgi:elongation factor P hydroxylase